MNELFSKSFTICCMYIDGICERFFAIKLFFCSSTAMPHARVGLRVLLKHSAHRAWRVSRCRARTLVERVFMPQTWVNTPHNIIDTCGIKNTFTMRPAWRTRVRSKDIMHMAKQGAPIYNALFKPVLAWCLLIIVTMIIVVEIVKQGFKRWSSLSVFVPTLEHLRVNLRRASGWFRHSIALENVIDNVTILHS